MGKGSLQLQNTKNVFHAGPLVVVLPLLMPLGPLGISRWEKKLSGSQKYRLFPLATFYFWSSHMITLTTATGPDWNCQHNSHLIWRKHEPAWVTFIQYVRVRRCQAWVAFCYWVRSCKIPTCCIFPPALESLASLLSFLHHPESSHGCLLCHVTVVLSREKRGEMSLCHLVQSNSLDNLHLI